MKIHYICHYDDYKNDRKLLTIPSGVTKINYIKESLKSAGFTVNIVSAAEGTFIDKKINKFTTVSIDDKEQIIYPLTFGRGNKFLKVISRLLMTLQLICYLVFIVKRKEKVLVYHSLSLVSLIKFYKIFGGKVFFEVEEIYNAVQRTSDDKISKEISFLKGGKGYILVNDLMQANCGFSTKTTSCYGIYRSENTILKKINDIIHIVYAGVIGSNGSDVFLAIEVAKYLNKNYVLHILGYGSESNIALMKDLIDDHNKICDCKISYDGCLFGKEFLDFLSKCQIGLCTRVLEDRFSDYTFPSKVCVYIANALIPICTPIRCIEESKIKDAVYFSKDNTAEAIASVIFKVDFHRREQYKILLEKLNENFIIDLKLIFK